MPYRLGWKFIKKMNYQVFGSPFEIKDIGEHYLMFKKIVT